MSSSKTVRGDTGTRGRLSRADLLAALAGASGSSRTAARIADALGLAEKPDQEIERPAGITAKDAVEIPEQTAGVALPRKIRRPVARLWRLEKLVLNPPVDLPQAGLQPRPAGWQNRPRHKSLFYPLCSARSLLARLDHLIRRNRSSRQVDVDSLVARIGRGEPLTRIPRARKKSLGRHLCLINDLHTHLIPYWTDHWLAAGLISSLLPEYQVSRARLLDRHATPWLEDEDGRVTDWRLPPPGSVVVVFSDLGALSLTPRRQVQAWLDIGQSCKRQGCRLIALIPCHPDDCDPRLKSLFHLEPWETLRHVRRQSRASRYKQATYLLQLLSPAIRIEPGLLRAVRKAMTRFGKPMDGSIEAIVWQHSAIREPSSVAATPETHLRNTWLQEYARDDRFPAEERRAVLALIRSWRGHLRHRVWFEELLSLPQQCCSLVPQQDLQDMKNYFTGLLEQVRSGEEDAETRIWLNRLFDRLPDVVRKEEKVGLRQIRVLLGLDKPVDQTDYPLDPRKLPPVDGPERTGLIFQQGEELYLSSYPLQVEQPVCYSPLALIRYKRPLIFTTPALPETCSHRFQPETIDQPLKLGRLPREGTTVELVTDCETYTLSQVKRPGWAKNFGHDRYGIFVDLEIRGVVQRCRWIPPGTFMMGSPGDEPERDDDETLHRVTLTRGFWLADTAVTQELYEAVMGKNPSHFKGRNRPVEEVSWRDCQEFFKKLKTLPETRDLSFTLPTEAQWEYACRAGTTTPFSFGDNITPDQVNYDGNYPYNNGKKGEVRRETVEVKSLPCNDWGLYEMHGNVWEWCNDWYGAYPDTEVENPQGPEQGESRVLRGGSWFSFGRYCRSASRSSPGPGGRDDGVGFGFRLSPGQGTE